MNDCVHFLSDLHLSDSKPEITEAFVDRYLRQMADRASAIYMLGDLFDTWVGDDDASDPIPQVRDALKHVESKSTQLYAIVGNRDFLMGDQFSHDFQVTLLPDHHVMDLFGVPTLLMHGDLLCTDDVTYQQFRQMSHQVAWRQQFLSQSLEARKTLVQNYRMESTQHKDSLEESIMDVNDDAVIETMKQFGVKRLIHGHTHRPAFHEFTIDDQAAERIVLAEWTNQGSVLEWTQTGPRIITV